MEDADVWGPAACDPWVWDTGAAPVHTLVPLEGLPKAATILILKSLVCCGQGKNEMSSPELS